MILLIIFFGCLIRIKQYYYGESNYETEHKNQIEDKQIDRVAVNNIIRSVNHNLATNSMNIPNYKAPEVVTDLNLVTIRGTKPESINLEIRDMQVYKGDILYKGIMYHYENGKITIIE